MSDEAREEIVQRLWSEFADSTKTPSDDPRRFYFVAGARGAFHELIQTIAAEARRYAEMYPEASDGRNTFAMFAEWIEKQGVTR